ncbi:MAG: hypothetical protein KAS39_03570, partial [Actinomycetia bacterium]|nr:hypothetical protein [Actinomycetes bacterium]
GPIAAKMENSPVLIVKDGDSMDKYSYYLNEIDVLDMSYIIGGEGAIEEAIINFIKGFMG